MEEPSSKKPRFASVGESGVEKVLVTRVPDYKESTAHWMRVFTSYLDEKNIDIDLQTCWKDKLHVARDCTTLS